LVGSESE